MVPLVSWYSILFEVNISNKILESLNDDRILRPSVFLESKSNGNRYQNNFFSNLVNRLFVNRIKKSRFRLITVYSEISLKGR